jgi:hypothetical protein
MPEASTTVLVHPPTAENGSVYPYGGTCPPRRTSNAAKRLREYFMRVPTHAGHDSDLMPDSVPASWWTAFRFEGGHFSGRSGMLSAMIPERLGQ